MTQLILHHYDFSNFSEKIRLILGFKNLTWRSVEIPSHLPKPDYTPLTLGYRRTPALQIGADIYCDTALIADELERRFPEPSLYSPVSNDDDVNAEDLVRIRSASECLASWAEGPLLWPAALYITGVHAEKFPDSFHFDRAKLHNKPTPSIAQVKKAGLSYFAEMKAQLERIEALLSSERSFLFGDEPCLADFIIYGASWLLETIGGQSPVINEMPKTRRWLSNIAKIGHGTFDNLSPDAAIDIANEATPLRTPAFEDDSFNSGERVKISPRDEYSPAEGYLVAIDEREIVIRGHNDRVNQVYVHFPRIGYRVSRKK